MKKKIKMCKIKTKQDFQKIGNCINNHYYSYDKVQYVSMKQKVIIICPVHGDFLQTPHKHIYSKQGCRVCKNKQNGINKNKIFKDGIIDNFVKIHKNLYDYSKSIINKSGQKIQIICRKTGQLFWQTPNKHISGQGCPCCKNDRISHSNTYSQDQILERFALVHKDKYDYSKVKFKSVKEKVCIVCRKHGEFFQIVDGHLNGKGCRKCAAENNSKNQMKTKQIFIKEAVKINGSRFSYIVEYTGANRKMQIKCNTCNNIFCQTPSSHLSGRGCYICKQSQGQKRISMFLDENSIKYYRQKKFDKCKNITFLPFDFYLPDFNICIEYDGQQHFQEAMKNAQKWWAEKIDFKSIQLRDSIKDKFCLQNNIKLVRIPYYEIKNIQSIMGLQLGL